MIVTVAPGFNFKVLMITFELIRIEPAFIITSVLLSGVVPQDQLPEFNQLLFTKPVQIFTNFNW